MFDIITEETPRAKPTNDAPVAQDHDPVSQLRTAVRQVRRRDRSGWSGPALMGEAEDIARAIRELETELVLMVGHIESGCHTAESGAAGTKRWLESSCGMSPNRAQSVVKTARFVNEHQTTGEALATGEVPLPRVETLAHRVRGRRDVLYTDHENILLDLAASLSHKDFTNALRHWEVLADDVLTDREHMERHGARRLHISTTMHGMVMGEFFLEPTAGQHLIRAVDALSPPDAADVPGGARTLSQRRADALTELAGRYLKDASTRTDSRSIDSVSTGAQSTDSRSTDIGSTGAEVNDGPARVGDASRRLGGFVPDMAVNVMIDLATLQGVGGQRDWSKVRCEIDGVGPVGRGTIERIVCGGHLRRVIVDSQSNVINQGRAARFATPSQRAALIVRDGGCIGCGRPSHWTEVHHIYGWVNASGRTNLDELVLLCQRCHTLVHEGAWRVERLPNGRFTLVAPDPSRCGRGRSVRRDHRTGPTALLATRAGSYGRDMATTTNRAAPRVTPPGWVNRLMGVMLRTPGLQRLVGRGTALVTVVGRKTGRHITTPISFTRLDGSIILTAHESRQWWRNAQADPTLQLRLAGKERSGIARILRGNEALPYFIAVLEDQRMVAKANGVAIDDDGHADPEQAAAVLEDTVVVLVQVTD